MKEAAQSRRPDYSPSLNGCRADSTGSITAAWLTRDVVALLGRCSNIMPNEPDFGMNEEEIARYWCERAGIPFLGRADIGRDADNNIVPFGR